jgi:hypothetical protein
MPTLALTTGTFMVKHLNMGVLFIATKTIKKDKMFWNIFSNKWK